MWGSFFSTNKVGYVTLHFPKHCRNRFHFRLKLPAVPEGDCLSSSVGREKTATKREEKKGGGVGGVSHVCHPQPVDGWMWERMWRVCHNSAPQQCKSRWLLRGWEGADWTTPSNAALSAYLQNTEASPRPPSLLSITENIWIHFRRSEPAEQKVLTEATVMRVIIVEQRNATFGCWKYNVQGGGAEIKTGKNALQGRKTHVCIL